MSADLFREHCARHRLACAICRRAIDYTLRPPDPQAWELHIVRDDRRPSHAGCHKAATARPPGGGIAGSAQGK